MYKTSLAPAECKRSEKDDRRQQHLRSFFFSLFMRRRKAQRRTDDRHKPHYLDIHEPIYMYVAVAILILSSIDAVFTLTLLTRGAEEANPVMLYFMEINTATFVAVKMALTVASVVLLVAHRNFWLLKKTIRVETLLFASLVMYLLLINYELVLLSVSA